MRPGLHLPALASALVLASACTIRIDHEGYIVHEEQRFAAETPVELHLYTFDGAIEVRTWDRPEVFVDVEKRGQDPDAVSKIEVIAERTGSRIQIEARHAGSRSVVIGIGRYHSPAAKLVASVPAATSIVARSGDGSIQVERVTGRVEVRTGDGSIRVTETTGELFAETGDGSIRLEEVSGRIEARTGDGTLRLSGTPSQVRARTGDGSIVLIVRPGAAMDGDWTLTTGDGSISVELPELFDARIEADPGSGRVRSDLALEDRSGGTRDQRWLRGRLGRGGHRVVLRTGDGSIRLSKL